MRPRAIEDLIVRFLAAREGTACPSEVARAIASGGRAVPGSRPPGSRPKPPSGPSVSSSIAGKGDWRAMMQPVRDAAARLARRGRVEVLQRGQVVDPATARGPIRLRLRPSPYAGVDVRAHPETYRVGRGEEGVLTIEPYKSELLPLWRFRTRVEAQASALALWRMFLRYRREGDFPGMDMARKYLQMGFTRARRYANHRSGRKYDAAGGRLPISPDPEKAAAAEIFRAAWQRAEGDATYRRWRASQRRRPR